MESLDQFLKDMGLAEAKPKPKPKPEPVDRTPTDPWWKRGEECPH